jgi:hypothetical protein
VRLDALLVVLAAVAVVPLASAHGPPQGAAPPAADVKLELRPWGIGSLTVDPPGVLSDGTPAPATCDRAALNDFTGDLCEHRYPAGTEVTVTAAPGIVGSFLGWSSDLCAGTAPCRLRLDDPETSLVARFTPVKLGVRIRGTAPGSARIRTDPPGLECTFDEGDCTHPVALGRAVTLVADPGLGAVHWKFGCTPSATDPRRCTVEPTHDPHWVGVAVGRDEPVGRPATIAVRFRVRVSGEGTVRGRQLDCGTQCDRRYEFGVPEELFAQPRAGWRFTSWRSPCQREQPCRIVVGPVTSTEAVFTRNLAPRLHSLRVAGSGPARRFVARISVAHEARARVVVRRVGAPRVLLDRVHALNGGANTVTVPLPRGTAAGRYRVTIAVSDGMGGGRTFVQLRRVGR